MVSKLAFGSKPKTTRKYSETEDLENVHIIDAETPLLDAPKNHHDHSSATTYSVRLNVFKACFAFAVASSLTLIPELRHFSETYYINLAAVSVIILHPSRTIGAMLEMILFSLCFVFIATVVSVCAIQIFRADAEHGCWYITASLILLLNFLATFAVSYLKAKYQRPSIAQGSSIFQLVISVIILRYATFNKSNTNSALTQFEMIWTVVGPVLYGMMTTLSVNLLIAPQSASVILR